MRLAERGLAWEVIKRGGCTRARERQRAEEQPSPVIGGDAAFNNRKKEELEMHVFVRIFPQTLSSLSRALARSHSHMHTYTNTKSLWLW